VVLRGVADGDLGPASVSEGDQRVVRWGERRGGGIRSGDEKIIELDKHQAEKGRD
jgi:hypothetical protein